MAAKDLKPFHFKKGQSGNPAGKPKGAVTAKTVILKWLETKMDINDPITKQKLKGTVMDNMVLAMLAKAMKGDVNAFNALADRGYGKTKQEVDVTSDGKPVSTLPPQFIIIEDKGDDD